MEIKWNNHSVREAPPQMHNADNFNVKYKAFGSIDWTIDCRELENVDNLNVKYV